MKKLIPKNQQPTSKPWHTVNAIPTNYSETATAKLYEKDKPLSADGDKWVVGAAIGKIAPALSTLTRGIKFIKQNFDYNKGQKRLEEYNRRYNDYRRRAQETGQPYLKRKFQPEDFEKAPRFNDTKAPGWVRIVDMINPLF